MTIEQFVPAGDTTHALSREEIVANVTAAYPEVTEDMAHDMLDNFLAMRRRLNQPMRRDGTPMQRVGSDEPLFPPVHYIRGDDE